MRASFEEVEYAYEQLHRLFPDDPDGFCSAWVKYLMVVGWTEEDYEAALDRRAFNNSN
jgi:hypothetical protein